MEQDGAGPSARTGQDRVCPGHVSPCLTCAQVMTANSWVGPGGGRWQNWSQGPWCPTGGRTGAGLPWTPCVICTVNQGHIPLNQTAQDPPEVTFVSLWETHCCQWKSRHCVTGSRWGVTEEGNPAGLSSCSGGLISWRREWQPTPVFLPVESHGQRSLVGYSPQGRKESDAFKIGRASCRERV